jgi:hypothetical protein
MKLEDMYRPLSDFYENTNKQPNKIRKTMQDTKQKFSKYIKILKNHQIKFLEIKHQ